MTGSRDCVRLRLLELLQVYAVAMNKKIPYNI